MDQMTSASTPDKPLVTVVVATRNRDELLARALRSIDCQSYSNIDIVVIDDGSSEEIWSRQDAIVDQLARRVTILRSTSPNANGTGPSAARNRGIFAAKGEYVAFLDDDDEWTASDHLDVAIDSLKQSSCDLYFANMKGYRGDIVVMNDWFPLARQLIQYPCIPGSSCVRQIDMRGLIPIMQHHIIHPDSMVAARRLLVQVNGFWERVGSAEDWELMMRLIDAARGVIYRPDTVARYRLPEGDSISLKNSPLEKKLQHLVSAIRVQMMCNSKEVSRCAAAKESWCHRELALLALKEGAYTLATRQAFTAFLKYPTAGGMAFLARVVCGNTPSFHDDPRVRPLAQKSI